MIQQEPNDSSESIGPEDFEHLAQQVVEAAKQNQARTAHTKVQKEGCRLKGSPPIFISHSFAAPDKRLADAICRKLERRCLKCWIAPRDIRPGSLWAAALADAISTSRILVVILTAKSIESKSVLNEVALAAAHNVMIFPILAESVELIGALKFYLQAIHWLDATAMPLEQLIDTICDRIQLEAENMGI